MTSKQKNHNPEFNRKAAEFILSQSYTYPQAREALGVSETALKRWVHQLFSERNGITPKFNTLTAE